jgi:hypothetical protein
MPALLLKKMRKARRDAIVKESEFYVGPWTGGPASLSRGDAKAGLIITAVKPDRRGACLGYTHGMDDFGGLLSMQSYRSATVWSPRFHRSLLPSSSGFFWSAKSARKNTVSVDMTKPKAAVIISP